MTLLRYGIGITVLVGLVTLPVYTSDFVTLQIGVQALYLAILAMSLTFLAGFGGMVSLAQIALFGVSGYTFAHLTVIQGVAPSLATIAALLAAPLVSVLFAFIAVRTEGIYFLMITLALAMLTFNFALQNRNLTRGFSGINGVRPPAFVGLPAENPHTFYYVALVCALLVRCVALHHAYAVWVGATSHS